MYNNDILIRTRFALDLKDLTMQEIFKLGGKDLTIEYVQKLLAKTDPLSADFDDHFCDDKSLDIFLNGLIVYKRGKRELKPGEKPAPIIAINAEKDKNNIVLKKLKTALSLTSEDVLEILKIAGVTISKTELSAVLRKEGDRHYKECGDRYMRNFLKGLTIKYRDIK